MQITTRQFLLREKNLFVNSHMTQPCNGLLINGLAHKAEYSKCTIILSNGYSNKTVLFKLVVIFY